VTGKTPELAGMTGMEIPIQPNMASASMNDIREPIENLLNFFTL
jgi:hypothetical protein